MKTRIRFQLSKGESKKYWMEKITLQLWQFFKKQEIEGKIGAEYAVKKEELEAVVAKFLDRHNLISPTDKENIILYKIYLERLTAGIIINHLTDRDDENLMFYPGLLNLPGEGYFVARNHEEVDTVNRIKQSVIHGMEKNLEGRIIEAHHKADLLEGGKNREYIN